MALRDSRAQKLPAIKVRPDPPVSRDSGGQFAPAYPPDRPRAQGNVSHPPNPSSRGRKGKGAPR
jgi:hypothetical protein